MQGFSTRYQTSSQIHTCLSTCGLKDYKCEQSVETPRQFIKNVITVLLQTISCNIEFSLTRSVSVTCFTLILLE